MNLLLFEEQELRGDLLCLTGRRHRHLIEVLNVRQGDTVKIGQVNGRVGVGLVEKRSPAETILSVAFTGKPKRQPDIGLILALPRPVMLQRILKQATVLGVNHFYLVRSARVEKSYFHSPVLQPERIRELLVEGLEQAMDTRLPTVELQHRFKPFIEDVLPRLRSPGVIAHPGVPARLPEVFPAAPGPLLLAVGPEGGWSDYEYHRFIAAGFSGCTMGQRILHVDTAVVALLAQVALLRDLRL
ncbi:MAG: 16S rRNA (uracil(1498)-N(3))-methyltransferase [Desulfobulbus propionicus]|nr:MAG: 16S rRNA (uracil(1498)-N(3))-methyltransferase [Desulfobulbus propionicus]